MHTHTHTHTHTQTRTCINTYSGSWQSCSSRQTRSSSGARRRKRRQRLAANPFSSAVPLPLPGERAVAVSFFPAPPHPPRNPRRTALRATKAAGSVSSGRRRRVEVEEETMQKGGSCRQAGVLVEGRQVETVNAGASAGESALA